MIRTRYGMPFVEPGMRSRGGMAMIGTVMTGSVMSFRALWTGVMVSGKAVRMAPAARDGHLFGAGWRF